MIRPDDYHLAAFRHNHDPHPEWRAEANCAGVDPNLFFPGPGESAHHAQRVCAACPVRGPCLIYALDNGMYLGVWGGTTGRQRRMMKRGAA